jgi:hypothetical protein
MPGELPYVLNKGAVQQVTWLTRQVLDVEGGFRRSPVGA